VTELRRVAMTVRGPVDPTDLGISLLHEHLWMDARPLHAVHGYTTELHGPWDEAAAAEARWNPGVHPANYRLTNVDLVVAELAPFVAAGGRTIAEMTPPSLGRDPRRVREIAERSGVHVIQGTGQYLEAVHEPWLTDASEAGITARLIREATEGIDDTGIRAGIYGEIGTSNPVTPGERRVLRAVAAASRQTGLAVSVHLHPWGYEGSTVLDELVSAGADPERVILGHVTTAIDRPDDLARLVDRGAILGFDLFGFDHSLIGPGRWPPSDHDAGLAVARMVQAGHRDRLILSQDIGVLSRLRRWGSWGYAHVLEHVVPILRALGLSDDDLDAILVRTPARLLSTPA
jgi:phosphotriesterase-related protein